MLYVGGNDVANGKDVMTVYSEMKSLVKIVQKECQVQICSLCPRADVDVTAVSDALLQLCEDMNINLIRVHSACTFGNGETVRNYFLQDNIHLSHLDTNNFLKTINHQVTIITNRRVNNNENLGLRRSYGYRG